MMVLKVLQAIAAFFAANMTKMLGTASTIVSLTLGAAAAKQIPDLVAIDSREFQVLVLLNILLGGATIGVGFNNSARAKVATVIDNALQATPPKQGGFARVGMLFAVALLAGCAAFGVPKLESFGERLAGGYVTVTGARTLTTTLLNGQVIGSKDAQNVQDQANSAREGLDVASTLTGINAENKLNSSLAIANAALDYLCAKAPTDPNCLGR